MLNQQLQQQCWQIEELEQLKCSLIDDNRSLHITLKNLENERNCLIQETAQLQSQIAVMAKDIEIANCSMDQLRTASNSQIQQATWFFYFEFIYCLVLLMNQV
eukprot:TRINITY_DN37613_c0_g1_i1.p3 TRINITY_DN37613_c0_g1~~TRINITY_DN37613_c0_g1_i1.p3  ORF type:complete len:103 (+),score=21.09 TRINITY_DN37613_c0_g1_i1:315-623(+)